MTGKIIGGQNRNMMEEIPGQFSIDPLHDNHSFPALWESYQEFRRVSQPWALTNLMRHYRQVGNEDEAEDCLKNLSSLLAGE